MRERFDKHIPPEGEILDFGCGEGYMMNYLNKNRRRHMMGVEPSMAASAQAKLLGFDVQGGIESFPPENMNFFDAIVLFQVLEHLMDPKKFLREFSRLLVPDGKLIICCPNVNSQLRNTFKNSWINWHMPFHLWHFSPETLVSFMESEGWAVSHVETVTPPVWMFQTLTVEFLDYGFTSAREGFATMREKRNGQDPMSGDCIYLVASKADKSVSD
ncbi:MAG: class I SAM-dependent methyltransferase [Nitrospinaceae bacterium]|nr:class I SAM-dependent methyltransferase [Nitrospinaceae bacterium]MBT4092770.1 class I SAM-dependent methyltransferase [Nitrospinaceae bacterium]MBT4431745.1 class I SAM-dependent methyltransferase [Nitrospinaceae bacterium]MBT5369135.1 class I SAM-dependent methyltransferase [Nitrospinaceae bacterium]MBT6395735.1 class I SAM-dependent methyltransferase [Nitrospinaceae bacterium]